MARHTKDSYRPEKKGRKENNRLVFPPRYLIICEGTKTEPQYFHGLKQHMKNLYGDRVKIEVDIVGTGKNTMGILEKAKELIEAQSELNPFEKVWLVYDKDDFPKRNFNQVANWVNQRNNNGTNSNPEYNVAWSNECIELWFLLHYEYLTSQIKRGKYYKKLSTHFRKHNKGDYGKNNPDIFSVLYETGNIFTAIHNAKQLIALHTSQNHGTPASMYPATKVHVLVEELLEYIT